MTLQLNDCRTLKHPEFSTFEACTSFMSKVMSQLRENIYMNTCPKEFKQVRLDREKEVLFILVLPCGHFFHGICSISQSKKPSIYNHRTSAAFSLSDLVEVMRLLRFPHSPMARCSSSRAKPPSSVPCRAS